MQTFLEHGGKLPSGKLSDGTTKKQRAIGYICSHVSETPESLLLWGRVVAGYSAQWSAASYTVMVQDYYLCGRVPGEPRSGGPPRGGPSAGSRGGGRGEPMDEIAIARRRRDSGQWQHRLR